MDFSKIRITYFYYFQLLTKLNINTNTKKMSTLNINMSNNMEPLASWGSNSHTKVSTNNKENLIEDYVCYNLPRSMFRAAASLFSDIRHTNESAKFDEITLQLFLQMISLSINLDDDKAPDIFPYVKAWLEWVPHKDEDKSDRAVAYRIHAISRSPQVKFGTHLQRMLKDSSVLHRDSMNRKMNCRKVDPLSGLHPYQKWMKVSGLEMYTRTICDRYAGSQEFTDQMDTILNPSLNLSDESESEDSGYVNPVNPSNVFTIDRALFRTPDTADKRFMSRELYTGHSEANVRVASLHFPSAEHVFLLTPGQLHPKVFCSKYLPEHQDWIDKQTAKNDNYSGYDDNVLNEYDIRTAADMERERIQGLSDRSAFASLSLQAKIKYYNDCVPHENTEQFAAAYALYQEWSVKAMKTQCLDPDACISEVVSKMLTWRDNNEAIVIDHCLTDSSMSVFANRVIRLMEGYEQYYLISTAHRMMYLIQHARYDSFRRAFGLHFNCFQAGESACSKSFLFDQMSKDSIPGTVEVLTYQTGKADAVDGNRNDITTVCHEAPPGMFRTAKNPNADSSQEAMFKEKLTSQKVTAKVYCQDEATGRRSARLTKSECIGVWMGATNDPPSEVEEALATRFFWGNFEQVQRRGRDIDDCMNGQRMMTNHDKNHLKRLNLEAQEEQFRMMLVEKAIWTGIIKDVNTQASNIILPRLKAKMTKNSIVRAGPRDWERVKIFARNQAIVTAIEQVFNLPGGECYGQPFTIDLVPKLEPHLIVTEEMVIFTLSMLSDQFRSPVEHKILNTIWTMEKFKPTFGKPGDENSHDYIKLPRLQQLSKSVSSRIPLENGRTSANNIMNFIANMTKHTIMAKPYTLTVPEGTEANPNPFPVEVKGGTLQPKQSAYYGPEGVFIHVAHILGHSSDHSDSVYDILASETHKYSDNKRILTAVPYNKNCFHVFKVIERNAGGEELYYENVLANSEISRWITQTSDEASASRTKNGYGIYRDVDLECASKVSQVLVKQAIGPLQIIDRIVRAEQNEEYERPTIRYPETLVSSWKHKKKYKNNLSSSSSSSSSSKRKRNEAVEEIDTSKKTKIVA